MPLLKLAVLCILYHGCLWFVFDLGNPYRISPTADTLFPFYRPILVGADTCPNRKFLPTVCLSGEDIGKLGNGGQERLREWK